VNKMEKDTKIGLALILGSIAVPVIGGFIASYIIGIGDHPLE